MDLQKWIDSHTHLTDLRWGDFPTASLSILDQSKILGCEAVVLGGVDLMDWGRQKELKSLRPQQVFMVCGLHPYEIAKLNSENELEERLNSLTAYLADSVAVGETGLDLRPYIVQGKQELQFRAFELQLELANMIARPLVLHIVRAHHEALHFFDVWGEPISGAMVHSFNGSAQQAEDFLQRGFYLSVGGPLARSENQRLQQAVRSIPLENLLLESDGPDQPSDKFVGQNYPPWGVLEVAAAVANIKNISIEDVLSQTRINARKFFKL